MHPDYLSENEFGWDLQILFGVIICGAASSVGFAIRWLRDILEINAAQADESDTSPSEPK